MKKFSRLLALLLTAAMLLSGVALAQEGIPLDDFDDETYYNFLDDNIEPLPEIPLFSDPPVPSEIIYPTVDFDNVAPFKAPVSGPAPARMMRAAADEEPVDNGIELNKTATANGDGTYTISLEAYATGSKIITSEKKDVPTDIVLVLDQSGSMEDDIGTVSFSEYRTRLNSAHFENRHNGGNGNLYYPLGDGKYASVSVVLVNPVYDKIDSQNNIYYWRNSKNLYALVDGNYVKVSVTREEGRWDNTYTYTLLGETIATSYRDSGIPTFSGTDDDALYLLRVDESQNEYTYTYTDVNGDTQTIGTSTGANTNFETILYRKSTSNNGGGSRISALTNALKNFTSSVSAKAAGADGILGTSDDVNHRIAVVGFASKSGYGNNTELLSISGNNSGSVGVRYGSITNQNYVDVLQDMNTDAGQSMVSAAINALDAEGATEVNLGVDMANKILEKNPVETNEKRNRVVIIFTDGTPTTSSSYSENVANAAISGTNTIKNSRGATVYTVGVFAGADGGNPGSLPANNSNGSNHENRFMHLMSSNYPNASSMSSPGSLKDNLNGKSYYLSASDSSTLNSIFQQIAEEVEPGGSSSTLNSSAIIKDIIAPEFELPAGATADSITLKTYKFTGKDATTGEYKFADEPNETALGATATVNEDKVNVTGFNFSENWCGTQKVNGTETVREGGNKLVISFTVSPKTGFLGGNNVYTNTSAGIYENNTAEKPIEEFNKPQVNVPIGAVTVTAQDKNVYLLSNLTAEQFRNGATATVDTNGNAEGGTVSLNLDPNATNFGLEAWKTAYVNITVEVTDAAGNKVTTALSDLAADTTYNINVTVSPTEKALETSAGTEATAENGADNANVNVFKPVLTFRDSTVDYMKMLAADHYETKDYVSIVWKHGDTLDTKVTMIGAKPDVGLTYAADLSDIDETGKVISIDDIPVKVTANIGDVDITSHVDFVHNACNPACGWDTMTKVGKGDPAFLLHVINVTGSLTITKKGLVDTGAADCESAIFTVTGKDAEGNDKTWTVVINGNGSVKLDDLLVGKYTITEEGDWTWRYSTITGTGTVDVTGGQNTTVSVTNSGYSGKWLGGDNYKQNVFGTN
jgi:hypothetical protein